jgi:hypothetical protein
LIHDYLLKLVQSLTAPVAKGRSYEEQYQWLTENLDPKSSLEGEFLKQLYQSMRRLPDRSQYRPEDSVYCEADFYYERDGLKGIAVFVDGPSHEEPTQKQKDAVERAKLDNLGYRVLVLRYNRPMAEQIAQNPDIFGPGMKNISEFDAGRDKYVSTIARYQLLINHKYRQGLSSSEEDELHILEKDLDRMDQLYYEDLVRRLQALVDQKEAKS